MIERIEFVMTNAELQTAINFTTGVLLSAPTSSPAEELAAHHLKRLFLVQSERANFCTADERVAAITSRLSTPPGPGRD